MSVKLTHNQCVDWLIEIKSKFSKGKIVNLFLASLSTRNLNWRSGLPAFAYSLHFPQHECVIGEFDSVCSICGHFIPTESSQDFELINKYRLTTGGLLQIHTGAAIPAFYLDQLSREKNIEPKSIDFEIFESIVQLLLKQPANAFANQLETNLGNIKSLKSNKEERRALLETMSICGIIESANHKGFYREFQTFEVSQQRPSQKTDWGYPIRFWNGSEGINKNALEFWFNM